MGNIIEEDRFVSYSEIDTSLGISKIGIHLILLELLTVKKICIQWISQNSTENQKMVVLNSGRKLSINSIEELQDLYTAT